MSPTLQTVMIPVAVVGIESKKEVCPYAAVDAILEARKQGEAVWADTFRHWIADQLDVAPEKLQHQQVLAFNDLVCALVERLNEDRKKKVGEIVDWLLSTQESRATSESGTTS